MKEFFYRVCIECVYCLHSIRSKFNLVIGVSDEYDLKRVADFHLFRGAKSGWLIQQGPKVLGPILGLFRSRSGR